MIRRCILIALVLLAYGVNPGMAVQEANSDDSCIQSHSSVETEYADITGIVEQPPNRSDIVKITYKNIPTDSQLEVDIPSSTVLVNSTGFRNVSDGADLRYTGEGSPVIEYRIGKSGIQKQFTHGPNWLFAPTPLHIGTGVNLEMRPNGVVGNDFLYIGNYTEYTTTVGCHRISLVNTESGRLPAEPGKIIQDLKYAGSAFDVNHRYKETTIFATPKFAHLQNAGFAVTSDAWVTKSIADTNLNFRRVVLHEYIHTRQSFGSGSIGGMSWVKEGSAEFFSYKFALERGAVSPSEYNNWLRNGSRTRATLTNRSTWNSDQTEYVRGGTYMAVLNAKITASSNQSLQAVIRRYNNLGDPQSPVLVQKHGFLEFVENTSSEEVREWANESMRTSTRLSVTQAKAKSESNSALQGLLERFEKRTAKKPYAAVFTAFLAGAALVSIIWAKYQENRNESSEEQQEN